MQVVSRLIDSILLHDHVDVEHSIHLKVVDLMCNDGSIADWQTRHWVPVELRSDSLRANLMHDGSLNADILGDLRLKVRSM